MLSLVVTDEPSAQPQNKACSSCAEHIPFFLSVRACV